MDSDGNDLTQALAAVREATARVRAAQSGLHSEAPLVDLALRESTAHLEAARRVLFRAEVQLAGSEPEVGA